MKFARIFAFLLASLVFVACSDDDDNPAPEVIDTALPQGTFTVQRTGNFEPTPDAPQTDGDVQLGTDSQGRQFLRFGNNFMTNLATGGVAVYFSKSATLMLSPGTGNTEVQLVGTVNTQQEQFFLVNPAVGNDFTHVILWCVGAGVPFGVTPLN
ncbi:MAG: hypothetical protein HC880_13930 [Bacteroidia bacterium]|nr:hypothetical protein [Bacteroidia bacterium]